MARGRGSARFLLQGGRQRRGRLRQAAQDRTGGCHRDPDLDGAEVSDDPIDKGSGDHRRTDRDTVRGDRGAAQVIEIRGQRTEVRGQRSEGRGRGTEVRSQKSEVRGQWQSTKRGRRGGCGLGRRRG